jgi:DNA-directed RNA polymerase specialized sigma24 family protein
MTEIYLAISKLSDKFRTMCYGITKDKEDIDNSVQELMLYFMQMNPEVLSKIWQKDGEQGIIRYGAVVLKRALTSPRSPFYYKYKKYYTHIDSFCYSTTITNTDTDMAYRFDNRKNISNIPNEEVDNYQWEKLEEIDKVLDKLDSWYDKKIFELYYYEEGNTLDSLAAKTRISRNSLFTTIDKVRAILKKELVDE